MINLKKLLAVFFFISYNSAFSQTDTIPDSIPQKDIYGFFVVDKNSAYKRISKPQLVFITLRSPKIKIIQ